MTLHTLNKSAFSHQTPFDCLNVMSPNDALVLLEDGVYNTILNSPVHDKIATAIQNNCLIYAITNDIEARGLTETKRINEITLISYDEFVTLCTTYNPINSWY